MDRKLAVIHRHSGEAARVQQLGPYAIEALIRRDEEGAGTVYRVRIAPGEQTAVSYHRVAEEYYFVLAGGGLALLDSREYPLRTGDFLRLPPGTTHGFIAGDQGLDLLDVHTPGSWPDHDVYFVGPAPPAFSPPPEGEEAPEARPTR
jgi:mannose-6-phosphate isomerase-like protein (cupin superfamily)